MWISRAEYQRLVDAVDRAERRAEDAASALTAEREANRTAERHWADMFMRRMQTYPLPKTAPNQPADTPPLQPASEVPGMDQGAIEATVAAGLEMGVSRQETIRLLKQQAT